MEKKVKFGQVYQDRRYRESSKTIIRTVKVIQCWAEEGFPERVMIENTATSRRVWISGARLLDSSRFELVSEIGSLAPLTPEGIPVAA